MTGKNKIYGLLVVLFIVALACNAPFTADTPTELPLTQLPEIEVPVDVTESAIVSHLQVPSVEVPMGGLINDVESSGTGAEKRAPYGDSYDINLLERPFLQDMTYVPDLDIASYYISLDDAWYYATIKLIGIDPNNTVGINYAVELDTDKDGFGNFIVWAQPPYTSEWTTANVRVFADQNHNTAGVSASKSDAPFSADGYEALLFDGAQGVGDDPDLAWVRMTNDGAAIIQFAFKRSLAGDIFMAGVLADAGLKDVSKFDYVDRFTEVEAGSSVKDKKYYPLQALYSIDNTCRAAIGFASTGYEPMSCLKSAPSQPGNGNSESAPGCADPQYSEKSCSAQGLYYWPPPHCACSTVPYNP